MRAEAERETAISARPAPASCARTWRLPLNLLSLWRAGATVRTARCEARQEGSEPAAPRAYAAAVAGEIRCHRASRW